MPHDDQKLPEMETPVGQALMNSYRFLVYAEGCMETATKSTTDPSLIHDLYGMRENFKVNMASIMLLAVLTDTMTKKGEPWPSEMDKMARRDG